MTFPKIKIHLSVTDWIVEAVAGACIVALLGLVIVNYSLIPDLIPRHFNFSGQVDGTGKKSNLLVLPLIGIITYVSLTAAPKFPQFINYPFEFSKETAEKHFHNALRLLRVLK